jgi:putative AlgH/UPF0301 family transcriptional regulator
MIRSTPEETCREKLRAFSTKVAELDIKDPQSKEIRVLGFRGWHIRQLENEVAPKADEKK